MVGKQAWNLKLPTKLKIHIVFHVSRLEYVSTRKRQLDKALPKSEKDVEFEAKSNKKYEFTAIINSAVYG